MARASDAQQTPYPAVAPQPDYPAIEEAVLAYWEQDGTFQASVAARPEGPSEYVFYDGPPFANGLPHYGHLLTGYIKDVVPRYRTMRGQRVERVFGWDCHGLPAEMGAEKELGISGRQKILEFGIARFNAHCRASVLKYAGEWERYVSRQARWVDFENAYRTMDLGFMESVMWAFQALWDKGLVYESYRVMPYSWAAETPVSNFETRMDDSYRERQDPAITVRLEMVDPIIEDWPTEIWIWTTTPWTLPSNLAVAMGPDVEYMVLATAERGGRCIVIARSAIPKYGDELKAALGDNYRQASLKKGSDFIGRRYRPLFNYFADRPNAFRVLLADFVDTEEGTGIVHMAPGFGEDDQRLCAENGIEVVCPVDEKGRFTAEVPDWEGVNVLEANKPIIQELKRRGVLVRHETYLHNYPHCWRTDEPLIYRALSSWYVKVSAFRDRMVELNQRINWIPEHVRDGQFGKWLEGARDWSISRNRFWGSPIPVWKSDDPAYPRVDVYGSLDELERDFGVRPTDLHRPAIDELTRPNPDDPTGQSTMRRVEDVLDGWFESGSMPYAQVHYPFENKEWFESHFPADFITEYVAQTRGWFYTMHVLATALLDREPFQNCICHGVVVDASGRKLSKRLRNYPEPDEVFSRYGSDALRWFLCSSPIMRGGDLQIDPDGKAIGEAVRLVHNPIWNAYAFFSLYANADGVRAAWRTDATGLLDRYVLAKTRNLVEDVERAMDAYDVAGACAAVRAFLDALNNWYIRRSRPRFWRAEQDADKKDAYDTLYTVLVTLCRVAAPLLPMLTEEVHRGLTGERSVHLVDWPDAAELPADPALVASMDLARDVCSAALGLREKHRLRVRLPLAALTVAGAGAELLDADHVALIEDEVNVKDVRTSDELERFASFELKLDARRLGPRFGKRMKELLAAARAGDWREAGGGGVEVAGEALEAGTFELLLKPREGLDGADVQALASNRTLVLLETRTNPELEREGLARDVVRVVQIARKEAALDVSDRIDLALECDGATAAAVEAHADYIRDQTLASTLRVGSADASAFVHRAELGEARVSVGLAKAAVQ